VSGDVPRLSDTIMAILSDKEKLTSCALWEPVRNMMTISDNNRHRVRVKA
jgi:hypothetical protein